MFDTLTELIQYYSDNSDKLELDIDNPVYSSHKLQRLDPKNIEKYEKIGSGHFGEVCVGRLSGSLPVALKYLKIDLSDSNISEFSKEAHLLRKVFIDKIVYLIISFIINGHAAHAKRMTDYLK